mmetsp:Transcript_2859/g.6474  ORF Transcript_2859/g.6474 Transcript_2859/m.6474 type:complete len:365 (-) Transcript_2859:9-1103(-)
MLIHLLLVLRVLQLVPRPLVRLLLIVYRLLGLLVAAPHALGLEPQLLLEQLHPPHQVPVLKLLRRRVAQPNVAPHPFPQLLVGMQRLRQRRAGEPARLGQRTRRPPPGPCRRQAHRCLGPRLSHREGRHRPALLPLQGRTGGGGGYLTRVWPRGGGGECSRLRPHRSIVTPPRLWADPKRGRRPLAHPRFPHLRPRASRAAAVPHRRRRPGGLCRRGSLLGIAAHGRVRPGTARPQRRRRPGACLRVPSGLCPVASPPRRAGPGLVLPPARQAQRHLGQLPRSRAVKQVGDLAGPVITVRRGGLRAGSRSSTLRPLPPPDAQGACGSEGISPLCFFSRVARHAFPLHPRGRSRRGWPLHHLTCA